jgi:hypothetical protein
LAELCPAAEVFQGARLDVVLPGVHAMVGRLDQAQAAPDGLVPGAPETLMARQQASHWP